ncbi:MAG: hypothetical protein K1X74_09570 [Pirellulales bacterium]|nr:hypothetical protein [Pirellulales bacterium]
MTLLATITDRLADAWHQVTAVLHEHLAPALRSLQLPMDDFFNALPLWAGKVALMGLFISAAIWSMSLKRSFVYLGAPDQARWRDLRLWALAVLAPYVLIYWWLG